MGEALCCCAVRIAAGSVLALSLASVALAQEPVRISSKDAISAATVKPQPQLPMIARQLKLQGAVEIDVTIDEDGAVSKADSIKGNPVLAKAAQDAAKKWKFKPFKEGKVIATLTFEFRQ